MFFPLFLVALFVGYWAICRWWVTPGFIATVTHILVAILALLCIGWLYGHTALGGFVTGSWRFLSGVHTPDQIGTACQRPQGWVWLGVIIAILTSLVGLIAIFGLPVALAMSAVGAIRVVTTRVSSTLRHGLGLLVVALVSVVVAGLLMRLLHYMNPHLVCLH